MIFPVKIVIFQIKIAIFLVKNVIFPVKNEFFLVKIAIFPVKNMIFAVNIVIFHHFLYVYQAGSWAFQMIFPAINLHLS